ncbi:MAG TPA: hypothetical protein VMY88_09730 [Acidimicrobiales bacterium]|nr:hypothetical protein [Acidimicrobiales bacterium]
MAVHDPQALARWRTIFSAWRKSGLPVAGFCRSRDLTTSSFYRWRAILDGLDRPSATPLHSSTEPSPSAAFVPVRVIPEAVVEVILPSGLQLRVPLGADARPVARLVLARGAAPC